MLDSMKMVSRILPVLIVVVVGLFAASEWSSTARREPGSVPPAGEPRTEGETRAADDTVDLVRVFDGDSLIVRDTSGEEIEIRIHAIDAPERDQAYADESRGALRKMLEGEEIVVVEHTRDRYKRVVAKLVVDGRDVGLSQVAGGYAWHYKQFAEQQSQEDRRLYEAAQMKARGDGVGLWGGHDPIPPWEYRQTRNPRP